MQATSIFAEMSRIFVYPPLTNPADLSSIICRLAWYMKPYLDKIKAIHLVSTRKQLDDVSLPAYLDPAIEGELPAIRRKIVLFNRHEFQKAIPAFDPQKDLILIWNEQAEATASREVLAAIDKAKKKSGFWRVDPSKTRMEGSYYLHAGWHKFANKTEITRKNKEKFDAMAKEIGHHKKAYVYGTGPSLSKFAESHDFSDGISVISNSIVKNHEILEKTRPRIIVAADPLYHAGCSNYAGEFRASLIDAMRKTGAYFLCPIRDYAVYEAFFPDDLGDKVIGVPFEKNAPPNTCLLDSFLLKPYPNILTLMLLPVASTFADSISIVGCDGRRITDNAFFWTHDKKAQFNDRMEDIQKAHPAFFAINYNDYYLNHCRDLEESLAALEAAGKTIVTETPSLVPALNAREADLRRQHPATAARNGPSTIVIVDPDAKGAPEHFLDYDRKFAAACRNMGFNTALIARQDLDPALDPEHVQHAIRILTHHSWNYGNNANAVAKERALASFAVEMDQAMDRLEAAFPDGLICIYMYVGCVEVAELLEHMLIYRKRFRAFINLFWSYNVDHCASEYINFWRPALRRMNDSGRIFLSHSTSQIAAEYRRDWGLDISVMPHPSTNFNDVEANHLSCVVKPSQTSTTIRVLFAGGPRKETGFILSTGAANLLLKKRGIQVVLRANLTAAREKPGKDSGQELIDAFDRIDKNGIKIIDSDLSDDGFIDMIMSSDIVVIPYLPEAFSRRTSGILIDALILGKAVVVVEGTWLGDIVKQDGIGLCAAPTAQAIAAAVMELAGNFGGVSANIVRARSRYLAQNSWRALVAQIAEKLNHSGTTATKAAVSVATPTPDAGFDCVISINPDAESFFGHFLNYEMRLGRAMRKRAVPYLIAGPVDGATDVYAAHPEMERVFSVRTNKLYAKTAGETVPDLERFEDELDRYLYRFDPQTKTLLFMYCGSLELAEVFARLADRYTACTFAVSLYYLSWLDLAAPGLRAYWKPRLMEMARHPRIRLIVPSHELAETLRADFGVEPEILPHPSTSFHDDEVRGMQAGTADQDGGGITVVFPGNHRGGKGYELTRDTIKALLATNITGLKVRVRCAPDDQLIRPGRQEFFDSIRNRVEILDSYLDEAAFRALLQSADVVVLPYTPDRFANRTSGLLIDSLLLGIPCVVIRQTWLERTVNTYGFGVATDQNGEAMARGIVDALPQLNALKAAALAARDRYLATNSWEALAAYLAAPSGSTAVNVPTAPPRIGAQLTTQDATLPASPAQRLLIIGNGPSTRVLAEAGFDKLPADMDTWGTTAAYRYFEQVGWWPTYYALADCKVVFHHRENFAHLLDDPKATTRKFFLSWKVSDSPKLELIPHSPTGSFSLKKAIELGYREIYLIGMEGAYVEEILESRALSPEEIAQRGFDVLNLSPEMSKLRILERTPTFNPNYFFTGYQQKGDIYSLPQAHTHQKHWSKATKVAQEARARVINLSPLSKIDAFERGNIQEVFPYLPSDCWKDFRDPFSEKAQHAKSVFDFCVRSGFQRLSETVWRCPTGRQGQAVWRAIFSHVGVTEGRTLVAGMRISASRDLRLNITFGWEGTTDFEETGRFFTLKAGKPVTVHLATGFRKRHGKLKLQVSQIDCAADQEIDLTIEHVWLTEAVDSVVARHEADELTARQAGLAFAEGNDSFALATWLWLAREGKSTAHAEDIAAAARRIGMSADLTDVQRLLGVLGVAPATAQVPGPRATAAARAPAALPKATGTHTATSEAPQPVKAATATAAAAGGPHTPSFEHTNQFAKHGQNEWLFTHDPQARQQLLLANFDVGETRNRTYLGIVSVESDQSLTVSLSLARAGTERYEGSARTVEIAAGGMRWFLVRHPFRGAHPRVKIQLDVKECPAPKATLSLRTCILLPLATDVVPAHLTESDVVARANQLFHEEKYSECLPFYLLAARKFGLAPLEFIAQLALRHLGVVDQAFAKQVLGQLGRP